MSLLQQLLTQDSANSRFIYLCTNLTVCISVLALVASAIWKGVPSNALVLDAYIYLAGVLLSGGIGGAAGRWLTNKKSISQPPLESSESKTTTVEEKKIVSAKVKAKS